MNAHSASFLRWWAKLLCALLIIPIAPTGLILGAGWLLPNRVPWFIADASVPLGSILATVLVAYLLNQARRPTKVLRLAFLLAVALFMSQVARVELVFATPCVTQRGSHIDFQRQAQERLQSGQSECQ